MDMLSKISSSSFIIIVAAKNLNQDHINKKYIMKKSILLFVLFYSLSCPIYGQSSVGFSDPDNIQPLLDYRLPEWGYNEFFLDAAMDGFFNTRYRDDGNLQNNRFSAEFAPVYSRYRESESMISTLNVVPRFNYFKGTNDDVVDSETEFLLTFNSEDRFYKENSDVFFNVNLSGLFRQNNRLDEDPANLIDEQFLDRYFSASFLVGIGYGRLRNVNPMIRSLRLNERYNSLDLGQSLGNEDIFNAAEHFTRERGYQQAYDRPLKYFWDDLDQLISPDLSGLDPFDLLYLTDTSSEVIGQRQEGWEISGAAGIQYSVQYNREENNSSGESSSSLSENPYFSPTISGAWYKNLSLEHQVSLQAGFNYLIPFNRSTDYRMYSFSVTGSWLYNLTDRMLTNTSVTFRTSDSRSDLPSNSDIAIRSEINYFIENRLALFSSVRYGYSFQAESEVANGTVISATDTGNLQFNAGIRYYLQRGVF